MFIVIKNFSINRIQNTASLFTQFPCHLIESFKDLEFLAAYIFSNSLPNMNSSGPNRISANEYQIEKFKFLKHRHNTKNEELWILLKNCEKFMQVRYTGKVGAFRYFYSDFLINNSASISKVSCPLLINPRIEQM